MAQAVLHASSDPLPPAIALDASFVVKALNRRDRDHGRAYALYQRLVGEAVVAAICWPILRLEFWYAWERAVGDLSPTELDALTREVREAVTGKGELALRWPTPGTAVEKRGHRFREGERLLDLLLSFLRVTRVRLTEQLLEEAKAVIVESGLRPLDAMVCGVALMVTRVTGSDPSIATLDNDFRRAARFHVWGLRS